MLFLNKQSRLFKMTNTAKTITVLAVAMVYAFLQGVEDAKHPSTIKTNVEVRSANVLIDPRLRPYYIEVAQRLNLEGVNPPRQQMVSVTVGTLPEGILGMAMGMFVDNVINVLISDAYWYKLSEAQRRALLWHELAHDIYNVEHGSVEIMSTSMAKINTDNIEVMIDELVKYIKNGR